MKICHGHIILKNKPKPIDTIPLQLIASNCDICFKSIASTETTKACCLNPICRLMCHLYCLANKFLENGQYIPIDGVCILCRHYVNWGELIRKRNGCSDTVTLITDDD